MKERTPENCARWENEYQERVGKLKAGLRNLASTMCNDITRTGASASLPALLDGLPRQTAEQRSAWRRLFRPQTSSAAPEGVVAAQLLDLLPVGELPNLDRAVRTLGRSNAPSWRGISSLESLPQIDARPSAVHGLASFHTNGRIREQAVRELALSVDGSELPFLILRLDDWVAPIRLLVEAAVLERTVPSNAESLVRCLPLVTRLESLGRADHNPVLDAVQATLQGQESVPFLLAMLASGDMRARRRVLPFLERAAGVPWIEVLQRTAAVTGDIVLRCWSARQCVKRLGADDAFEILDSLRQGAHVSVRVEALRALIELLGDGSERALRTALFDRGVSAREFARFYLRDMNLESDFAKLYREVLLHSQGKQARIASVGLSETGTEVDVPLLMPLLESADGCDTTAALCAIGRLGGELSFSATIKFLVDERWGVSVAAGNLFVRTFSMADFDDLRAFIENGTQGSLGSVLWLVRSRLDGWPQLRLLLAVWLAPRTRSRVPLRLWLGVRTRRERLLADRLAEFLGLWLNEFEHGLQTPRSATPTELAELEDSFARASGWIPYDVRERLATDLERERAQA